MIGFRRIAQGAACIGLALALAACGGGGGGDSSSSTKPGSVLVVPDTATSTPAPAATTTPAAAPAQSASADSLPRLSWTGWDSGRAATFSTLPDISRCQAGKLTPAAINAALKMVNDIRALHRLPPVAYSTADEAAAMEAALMTAANGELSHTPPSTWKCYSEAGATGTKTSNLYISSKASNLGFANDATAFSGWMSEVNNIVANNVGHRRWLLDPFLGAVAFGRVAGQFDGNTRIDATTLKVIGNVGSGAAGGAVPGFVAYPQGDYPAAYFDPSALLSFSAIADTTTRGGENAKVSYAQATVCVIAESGAALAVSNVSSDNVAYGVPNSIQFAVAGLKQNVTYTVTISNVIVRGAATNYTYSFTVLP